MRKQIISIMDKRVNVLALDCDNLFEVGNKHNEFFRKLA